MPGPSCPNRINGVHAGTVSHVALCKTPARTAVHAAPGGLEEMKSSEYAGRIHGAFHGVKKADFWTERKSFISVLWEMQTRELLCNSSINPLELSL